ncbi:RNase A-like domain-containing protein [Actinomadura napierensis]|uniref:RNase A-like domain-containing protein n=1 Tax=Actinomadura napierensis TaxID=267854 RepID=UPI0031E36401
MGNAFGKAMLDVSRALHGNHDMAGKDYVGEFFGAFYDPIAQQIVIAWEKLVMALGGVTEGLTVTANNFVTAEWHSRHGAGEGPATKPVPQFHDFTYHRPASASGSGYLDFGSLAEQLAWDMTLPTVLKLFPRGHQDRLHRASAQWRNAANAVSTLSRQVNQIINTITLDSGAVVFPHGNRRLSLGVVRTWQEQMRTFCSRIWGTAPWDGPNADPAPLHVLGNGATALAGACERHAHAIDVTRSKLERRLGAAAFATLLGLVLSEGTAGISAEIAGVFDEKMLADCVTILVEDYYDPVQTTKAAVASMGLLAQLQHAAKRTPTLNAMEAQAESVGDRALHDFDYPGLKNTVAGKGSQGRPGAGNAAYPIDLAGQEGTDGAHVIDRHVGKTNLQLVDRLTQQNVSAASSFNSLDEAQRYVQAAIDSPGGHGYIANMLAHQNQQQTEFTYDAGQPVGRLVDQNGHVTKVNRLHVVIRRDNRLIPPFVVKTAYPTP